MNKDFSKTKLFDNEEDFERAIQNMHKFQELHNYLKNEFEVLIKIAEEYHTRENEYKILVRSCLIEFFGIIEADIFYYNALDGNVHSSDILIDFFKKFKLTFRGIGKTWGKEDIVKDYIDKQFPSLHKLRQIRNGQVHPKIITDLFDPKKEDLYAIINSFKQYDSFINKIMNNFFMGYRIR